MLTGATVRSVAVFILQVALGAAACDSNEPSCLAATASALVQRDHRRHLELPVTCEGRLKRNCKDNSLCGWNQNFSRCQARIAWFHVMKCGSSFGATLAHFANSSLPKLAHIPSCTGTVGDRQEDLCIGPNRSQGPQDFFVYKYPMSQWFPETFWIPENCTEPGCHRWIQEDDYDQWKGHFVGMFRKPQIRVASAYNHFVVQNPDNGTDHMVKHSNYSTQVRYLKMFARAARGTVTKMLAGNYDQTPIGCEFDFDKWISNDTSCTGRCRKCVAEDPSAASLELAMQRLRGFAFVGLTDNFDLSVCLFHVMFGGQCHAVEVENMRQSNYHQNYSEILEEKGIEDPYDGKIFDEASRIFWSNVAKYGLTSEICKRICPDSNATFAIDG